MLKMASLKMSVNTWIPIIPINALNCAAINPIVNYNLLKSLHEPNDITYLISSRIFLSLKLLIA